MERYHTAEMKRTIDTLISNNKFASKNVFAFGHCNATEAMIDYLSENEITVAAILDNNKSKQGDEYKGVKIVAPQYMKKVSGSNTIVLIATRFFEPMSEQLKELGYCGEIVKVVDYNSFAEYSLSDGVIKRKAERMLRGAETLRRIREQFPKHHLVICPNCALGDVYWACAYLPAYCTKKKIEHVVVIVIGNGCRQVAEMFGIANTVTLDSTKMDELVQGIVFNHEDNCIIAHHDRPYTDNIIKYLDKHFLSFTEFYRCGAYGMGKDVEPAMPSKSMAFHNKYNMKKDGALIISPYAKSMVKIPEDYWYLLAKQYSEKGFQVYTNVAGEEKAIQGTAPLDVPISQLVSAVEYAGNFIGIRSGICDILSNARCRKIVVFPDCYYSTTNSKAHEFFSMPGWEQIIYRGK